MVLAYLFVQFFIHYGFLQRNKKNFIRDENLFEI